MLEVVFMNWPFPIVVWNILDKLEDHFQFDRVNIFLILNKIMAIQNMHNISQNMAPY